jgi:hypothetical protein
MRATVRSRPGLSINPLNERRPRSGGLWPWLPFRFVLFLPGMKSPNPSSALVAIRLLHTVVWACMAGCIVALPGVALAGRLDWAAGMSAVVLAECGVIALNKGRCPLTNVAARYTEDRADNFDIYLPLWLARHNKTIFGTLFLAGELIVLWRWLG